MALPSQLVLKCNSFGMLLSCSNTQMAIVLQSFTILILDFELTQCFCATLPTKMREVFFLQLGLHFCYDVIYLQIQRKVAI